jgi:hypothetical protein
VETIANTGNRAHVATISVKERTVLAVCEALRSSSIRFENAKKSGPADVIIKVA